jgi:hypothetical protein
MSMASLERAILAAARRQLNNPKLKMCEILEWSTGNVEARDDTETVFTLTECGFSAVNVCVPKRCDNRKPKDRVTTP